MKTFIHTVLRVFLIVGLFAPVTVLSEKSPPPVPKYDTVRFDKSGRIDSVTLKNGKIVVNDELFLLNSGTRVITLSGAPGVMGMLRQGLQIAFNTTQIVNTGYPTALEILILQ